MTFAIRCLAIASLLSFPSACGSGTSGPTPGTDHVSATVDGVRFSADGSTISALEVPAGSPGRTGFTSGELDGPGGRVSLALGYVTGPGTYPLGVNITTNRGGSLVVLGQRGFWSTPSPASGSVTITALGNGRMRGRFQAVLRPVTPPTYGPDELVVTNGQFDVPLGVNYSPPQGDNLPSAFSMVLGGIPWEAGYILGNGGGTSAIELHMLSSDGEMFVVLEDVVEPGVYPLQTIPEEAQRSIYINIAQHGPWGLTPLDEGTITITSVSDTRIVGTIDATLGGHGTTPTTRTIQATFDVRTIPVLFP